MPLFESRVPRFDCPVRLKTSCDVIFAGQWLNFDRCNKPLESAAFLIYAEYSNTERFSFLN